MDRIIVPQGTKQNFYQVFEDLQDYIKSNLKRRYDPFISSYGISAEVVNGVVNTNGLKVQYSGGTNITIEPGIAITSNFSFIRTLTQTTISLNTVASGKYTISAVCDPYTDTPTAVINGFLFNSSGADSSDTRYHEATTFNITNSGVTTTASGVYLANIDWNGSDSCTIYDRRLENIFLLKDSIIDDSNIVKKDRDSTITGKVTLQAETSSDTLQVWKDSDGTVIAYVNNGQFYFQKPAEYAQLVTLASLTVTDNVTLPAYIGASGVTSPEFIIGKGILNNGVGLRALTEYPDPTNVINFRVYDVKPTSNKSESKAYYHLRWNYHDLNGSYVSNNIFEVTGLIEAGGNLDATSADIIDKYLYFPETGHKYEILTWDNTTKRMTLGDSYDQAQEEPTIPNYPCKIIDGAGTGYQVKITSNKNNSAELSFIESDTKIMDLDSSFIYDPQVSLKLALGESHWIQIRTVNKLTEGSYVLLPSGVYDPDHAPGGQASQSYGQPVLASLPYLENDGTLTATANIHGFAINVGGWKDPADPDKTAQEFEIAWTTLDSLDWTDLVNTTKIITANRHYPIATDASATFQVGVRAIQNNQVVSLTKETSVVSGGGGVPPNAVKIAGTNFNVQLIRGSYATKGGGLYNSSEEDFYLTDITWSGLAPAAGALDGRAIDFETGGYNNLQIFSNTGGLTNGYIWLNPGTATGDIPTAPENFTISSNKTGRRILQTNLPADFTATYVHVLINSGRYFSSGNPAVLRVYQDGQENSAGTIDLTTRNGIITGNIDVDIKLAYGLSRTLIVDLWDPDTSAPNNDASIQGHVDIYGEIIFTNVENQTAV